MKRTTLLKTMFLLCALVAGSSSVWALTKTEGFETKATATSYQGTVTISTSESDCGIGWEIYYGCVSTNDKIAGNRSAQMRWYGATAHVGNIPYVKTTTAIDGLTNVSFKARTSNTNCKMDVSYSSNGTSWTVGKTHTFSKKDTSEDISLDIPTGNKFVKFSVNESSTAPGSSSNYKLIVDAVVFTYTSNLETPTWSVSPEEASVEVDESTELELSTNYDGTLSFTSNATSIATVSYNSSTKKITVTGKAPGTTTITATGNATTTFEAVNKTINVTVNHPELAYNFTDVMGPLGYSYFGLTPSGSETFAQPEDISTKTDAYGVSIIFAIADGGTYPRFDAKYMRFYANNELTITAPSGSYIRKVVFVEPSTEKAWAGSMTADEGDYVSGVKTWYANSENVTSVVFTNDATKRIGSLEIYLNMATVPATITAAEYATFYAPGAVDFSNTGITAYTATDNETSVKLNEIANGQVPANTPVVLYKEGADGTAINVPVIASANAVGDNDLHVSDGTTATADQDIYVLSKKNNVVGFYKWGGDVSLSAGKIYLKKITTGSPEFLGFGDVTAIEKIANSQEPTANGQYYNLNGQRVAQPTKGLYIVNGKKVTIK